MEYITNFFSSTVKPTHTPRTQLFDELCSNYVKNLPLLVLIWLNYQT